VASTLAFSFGDRQMKALAYEADASRRLAATLVLAHGAGAGMSSRFIVRFATGLAARGVDVLTFNFLYIEQNRKVPDRTPVLEACYRALIAAARTSAPLAGNRLFIGGKSMGGRIASHVAAAGDQTAGVIAGVVMLGYPLHPPGKPDQLRVAHLPAIRVPMLVLQGERDPFGTPEELRPHFEHLAAPVTLHVVERGDHSLALPKAAATTTDQLYEHLQDVIAHWLSKQPIT
jgi:predicted alpha/beta-hydrolase family hydrolase